MFLSFPAGTKMFQFPAYAPALLVTGLQPVGFPHSEISGSVPVCRSPELIAAYHVLLRLRKPRHPPFALLLFLVLCESCATLVSLTLLLAYEIVVPLNEKIHLLRLIIFFFFTLPRYLSQYFQGTSVTFQQ